MPAGKNWIIVAESRFPWERDALDFVRAGFPDHEPYRAWSNFEFIADDGSVNEVDLLVFTPMGLFLIEIKSRPGRLYGDPGTWTWETDGRLATVDNPLFAANAKAKKLRALLQQQSAFRKKGDAPFVEALVFCSAPELRCELQGNARFKVCLRDRPPAAGIFAAVKRRECPGLEPQPRVPHDKPLAKLVSQAMEQAGVRPSQRHRKVSDFVLEQLIGEGPGYQDWLAGHSQLTTSKRRVRLYLVRSGATAEDRTTIQRAAQREFQLVESLPHVGILRTYGYTEHELGPALIFEHDPHAIRLDHFLAQKQGQLAVNVRLHLVRQIAEVMRFAHERKIVHRSLCPQSILVTDAASDQPRIKILNWQVGYRTAGTAGGTSREVTATSHVDRLVDDASTAYMAPEALTHDDNTGEHLDVFSLGAIAYHIFSGEPPAANGLDLSNKLRETKGLHISSVLNGAGANLQFLVQHSTHPVVPDRIDSVADFLGYLDDVEKELLAPEHEFVADPCRAQIGDVLPGNLKVIRRLGSGACSVVLLVERDGQEFALKIASDPEHNARLRDEAEVLQKLRHPHIVEHEETLELGDRAAFLMRPVYAEKSEKRIETLGQRLRKEGKLHIDLLQRFGDDLLGALNFLEEQGLPHRDIKPENIAVGMVGRGDKLHLVLFDFSLSRTPPENIRAGTTGYLDPLLPLRKPPRWDLHAERYAAAVTLYELATGTLPKWGDGNTDPSHLNVEVTLDAELFDASLRDSLTEFFQKAFRRNSAERFDNGESMLREWRKCFEGIEEPGSLSDHVGEDELAALLAPANFDTSIHELGLGARATNALDRANILTVEDLLTVPMRRLLRLRGVGNRTRREITSAVKLLRDRLGNPAQAQVPSADSDEVVAMPDAVNVASLSVDLLADRITRVGARDGDTARQALFALLGVDAGQSDTWPSQSDVARILDCTRARIGQLVGKFQERWAKEPALAPLGDELYEILHAAGGAMTVPELSEAIIIARGCVQDEPQRNRLARAVVRAAVEVERGFLQPRFFVRREGESVLIATSQELAAYAFRLGEMADRLATEDPLLPPARALERLREVALPFGSITITDARLVRLAASASSHAALSSRQELYPRGMSGARALKLCLSVLGGARMLTEGEVRERVLSRYPEASVPVRPELDRLLAEWEVPLNWDAGATIKRGDRVIIGCYVSPTRNPESITSGSASAPRLATSIEPAPVGEITPEEADARQFEERLQRAIKDGSFLSLLVHPKYYERAVADLCRRFPVELVDFEGLFLDTLREVASQAHVNWELVLSADTTPGTPDWNRFMLLVGRVMPLIEQRLATSERTFLVVYPGLLARYDRMDLLQRLRDRVGRREGIHGLWLLVPGDHTALVDGKPIPIISPGQRARIPESWLRNVHRAATQENTR